MWMFNPGNPTRGGTKLSERDEFPTFAINKQITIPPFFTCDIPGGGLLATYYPGVSGRVYMKRYFPNGKLVPDFVDRPNVFSYLEVGGDAKGQMFGVYFGNVLYAPGESYNTYVYTLEINGDVVYSGSALTLDQLWEILLDITGAAPTSFNDRLRTIYDYEYYDGVYNVPHPLTVGLVIFTVPVGFDITIKSSIVCEVRNPPYTEAVEATRTVVAEDSANEKRGWHVEWMGGVIGAMQRPFLKFNEWIIGDLASVPPAWEGPISFDVLSPVDLDLYEILIAANSNPYSAGTVIRGEFLGKTTLYPAWS